MSSQLKAKLQKSLALRDGPAPQVAAKAEDAASEDRSARVYTAICSRHGVRRPLPGFDSSSSAFPVCPDCGQLMQVYRAAFGSGR